MFSFIGIYKRYKNSPTIEILDSVETEFKVGLGDIDFNLHLNNAKYLKYMDRARVRHIVDSGLLKYMRRAHCNAVVANTEISYVKELRTLQTFTVTAKVIGWDDKYLYYEQKFISDGRLCTHAYIRIVHLYKGKSILMKDTFDRFGLDLISPDLPEPVIHWKEMIHAKQRLTRKPLETNELNF